MVVLKLSINSKHNFVPAFSVTTSLKKESMIVGAANCVWSLPYQIWEQIRCAQTFVKLSPSTKIRSKSDLSQLNVFFLNPTQSMDTH